MTGLALNAPFTFVDVAACREIPDTWFPGCHQLHRLLMKSLRMIGQVASLAFRSKISNTMDIRSVLPTLLHYCPGPACAPLTLRVVNHVCHLCQVVVEGKVALDVRTGLFG